MNMNLSRKINKQSFQKFLDSFKYAFYVITHPFDGFWDLTHEKRGSLAVAHILVFLTLMTNLWTMRYTNFMFNTVRWERVNIWTEILGLLAPLLIYCVANWCLTTLFDGKGRMKDIYIGMAYALTPYILITNPVTIISNFVTIEEGAFISYFDVIALGWSLALILVSVMQVHDYSFFKAILTFIFSIAGMMIIVFLLLLFFDLISDGIGFFISLYKEIMYRLY